MKISFIIPYHDEPHWMLRECIDSILALKLADDEREIIVVDDGSKESPSAMLTTYGDKTTLLRQDNQGPGAARNNGIAHSQGDYIQFIDSDDRLQPTYAQCIDILRKDTPDLLLFHGNKTPYYLLSSTGTDYMLHHNLRGAACCLTFRRQILGNLRYDTQLINEDELFNAHLVLQAHTLIDAGIHAYYYRQRTESRSHSVDISRIRHRLDDAETIIRRLRDESETLPPQAQAALRRRTAQLTMDYLYNIVTLTRSMREFHNRCKSLRSAYLLPLPLKWYTAKYVVAAILSRILIG